MSGCIILINMFWRRDHSYILIEFILLNSSLSISKCWFPLLECRNSSISYLYWSWICRLSSGMILLFDKYWISCFSFTTSSNGKIETRKCNTNGSCTNDTRDRVSIGTSDRHHDRPVTDMSVATRSTSRPIHDRHSTNNWR